MSAQLELDLNAIERSESSLVRLKSFADHIPVDHYIANEQEPPSIIENHRPPLSWPSAQGGIDIENARESSPCSRGYMLMLFRAL